MIDHVEIYVLSVQPTKQNKAAREKNTRGAGAGWVTSFRSCLVGGGFASNSSVPCESSVRSLLGKSFRNFLSNEKKPGWLVYIEYYTTQLYGNYNTPL